MQIEKLFKYSLITTFFMNMAGALTFIPPIHTIARIRRIARSKESFLWLDYRSLDFLFRHFISTFSVW